MSDQPNQPQEKKESTQISDYRIRKLIGVLGLVLPVILPLSGKEFLGSMSHYYYHTFSSLLFIIILSTFGLFLISYKGYKIDPNTEKISDDILTNIGGLAALVVVFVPTYCLESQSDIIDQLCQSCDLPLFGHKNKIANTIHLVSAGIFIFTMGWMSKYKFTRNKEKVTKNKIYTLCGNIVWGALGALIVLSIITSFDKDFKITKYDVFILETIAVIPFSISWLIKGRTVEAIKAMIKTKGRSE